MSDTRGYKKQRDYDKQNDTDKRDLKRKFDDVDIEIVPSRQICGPILAMLEGDWPENKTLSNIHNVN